MTSTFLGGAIALSEGKWIDRPCAYCGRLGSRDFRGEIVCQTHLIAAIRDGAALRPDERRKLLVGARASPGLYADTPGSGPENETCGTCANLSRKRMSKVYLKCELMRARWSGGPGTDVKARSPACSKWEPLPADT